MKINNEMTQKLLEAGFNVNKTEEAGSDKQIKGKKKRKILGFESMQLVEDSLAGYNLIIANNKKKCAFCSEPLYEYRIGNIIDSKKCSCCGAIHIKDSIYDLYEDSLKGFSWALESEVQRQRTKEKLEQDLMLEKEKKAISSEILNQLSIKNNSVIYDDIFTLFNKMNLKMFGSVFLITKCKTQNVERLYLFSNSDKATCTTNSCKLLGKNTIFGKNLLKAFAEKKKRISCFGDEYEFIDYIVINEKLYNEYINYAKALSDNAIKQEISPVFTVYIYYKFTNKCMREKHDIESVTLKTTDLTNNKPLEVNAFHCKDCRKYFINYEVIKSFIDKNVIPALKYRLDDIGDTELNYISELRLYGYSVKADGLNNKQREELLKTLIDRKILTKQKIIQNIQFYIGFLGKKAGMDSANDKWRHDLNFVSNYISDNRITINGVPKR